MLFETQDEKDTSKDILPKEDDNKGDKKVKMFV